MTTVSKYDKRKLIILRAVLIIIGGAVGYLAVWQYFEFFPDVVKREYMIVITVVTSFLAATLLGLSAKPFYRLGASIAASVGAVNDRVGIRGIVATALALIASGAVVTVFDVIIRNAQNIWAVRLLLDVLVYIVCASLCCYIFTKWLNTPETEETEKALPRVGYLLTAECFTDVRVNVAARTLINVKVCDGAYKALCLFESADNAQRAIKTLDELISCGAAEPIRSGNEFSDRVEYAELERSVAAAKRLILVSVKPTESSDLSLDVFSVQGCDGGTVADTE